jgi:hypothetical protein
LNAVLDKLDAISPHDGHRLQDFLVDVRKLRHVTSFDLNVPQAQYRAFPIDRLLIVPLTFGEHDKAELSARMAELLELASSENLSALILPCLGINWQNKNYFSFDDFFSTFFHELSVNSAPRDIYIALYMQWPSFELENGITALKYWWEAQFREPYATLFALYHREFRSTMLFTAVCLLICSFRTALTLKTFVIISVSYITSALASKGMISVLTEGQPALQAVLQLTVLLVLSIFFPLVVRWDPKVLFSRHGKRQ